MGLERKYIIFYTTKPKSLIFLVLLSLECSCDAAVSLPSGESSSHPPPATTSITIYICTSFSYFAHSIKSSMFYGFFSCEFVKFYLIYFFNLHLVFFLFMLWIVISLTLSELIYLVIWVLGIRVLGLICKNIICESLRFWLNLVSNWSIYEIV